MSYFLDTNIIIEAANVHPGIARKFVEHDGTLFVSALVLAELRRGTSKGAPKDRGRQDRLNVLLRSIPVLPFDSEAAESYGRIVSRCGFVRSRDFDRMIAAHVLSMQSVLVTNNEADFRDIPGLTIENWAAQ